MREVSLTAFTLPVESKALSVRDKTTLPAQSTGGSFFPLPSLASAAGTVEPDGCRLVRVAGPVPLAELHGDATSVIVGAPPLQMGEQA